MASSDSAFNFQANVVSKCANYFIFNCEEQAAKFCILAGGHYFPGYASYNAYIPGTMECEISWLYLNQHLRY